MKQFIYIIYLSLFSLGACDIQYSMIDGSIDAETFSVALFEEQASNAPAGYAANFTDFFKDYMISRTKLNLKNIDADIYCLINSDIEVTENWIPPILDVFSKEKNTAIIQPKILDFKARDTFEYAGAGGGFIDLYGYPYCRGRVFNHLEQDNKQFDDVAEIFWASGACFFIRSKVYHELQGFDEDYFAHQEEVDLCWRAQNEGFDVKYVGEATVYHVGGATLQETNPQKTFLNFRNSLLNIIKNVPKQWFLFVVFLRLILDGVAGIKFLLELRPIHTWAIIKAHVSVYVNFYKFLKKRKKLQKKYEYNLHTSIVWQYFVLRRKKFQNLR